LNAHELFEEFTAYVELHAEFETAKEQEMISHLLDFGRLVRQGNRTWTRRQLAEIIRWKNMHTLKAKIEQAPNIESSLADAFRIKDQEDGMDALCRIPGIGPVLTSVLLTLTFPERYAPLDIHAWNGLWRLGFEFERRTFSGGGYTIAELIQYEKAVIALARVLGETPWETAKALHALDQVCLSTPWKHKLEALKTTNLVPRALPLTLPMSQR